MLLGREFQLATATIAIDATCVAVRLPVKSVVKVISESSDGKMVHVLSDGRQFAMFAMDLTERGQEIKPAEIQRPGELRATLDLEQIRTALQRDVEDAQRRRVAASERFSEVMGHLPSGIPYPDGTDRIRLASREYSSALKAATIAMTRLNEFLIHGTIPPEIERKSPGRETIGDAVRKAGQG